MTTAEVWQAPLDVDDATLGEMERTLSPAERRHARAIRDPLTRWRWVADHGWRRRLLARTLGCGPGEVDYVVNEHGRPDVAGVPLSFSASRSGAGAVYALSRDAVVGVDVEQLRPGVDVTAFARRFFSAAEGAALAALAPEQRDAGCFACWTRKEAYAKAAGTGLVFPLSGVEVWAGDDRPVRLGDAGIHTLALGLGRAGALAVVPDGDLTCQIRVSTLSEV